MGLSGGTLINVILNKTKWSEESRMPVITGVPAKAGFRKLNFAALAMTVFRIQLSTMKILMSSKILKQ